ncbi:sensor histidine kinase [Nocardia inohanensis]|uniref:sensor histidine kinase n=1 Tax=Nocardia inohanensis TaxID=209246 RepID=UPI001FDEE6E2|nr:sensor histidine kinase [Nocardia inohanensis]
MDEVIARRRRIGWVFAAIWSVYLYNPLHEAWQLDDPVARVYSLLVVTAFGVCYIGAFWVMLRSPSRRESWPSPDERLVFVPVAVLSVLVLAAAVTLRWDVVPLTVYIATFVVFNLPLTRAVPLIVVLLLAATVLPQLIAGAPPDYSTMQSIAMGSFAVGGVRQVITRNQQLEAARKRLTELAVAEERLRVGRDVHDILGHSLTVITVKTELAQRLIDIDTERAKTELADIEKLARESLASVRTTVGGLREVSLAGELANARTALRAAGIEAELPDSDDLPIRNSVVFGWVLRESVTNIVRHSGARHTVVRVTPTSIEIADDGVGLGDGAKFGSGLSGLRERVRATGGTLTLADRPEGGLRVLASFPADKEKE